MAQSRVSVTLREDVRTAIEEEAARERRTVSSLIGLAVLQFLERRGHRQFRLTRGTVEYGDISPGQRFRAAFNEYFGVDVQNGDLMTVMQEMADIIEGRSGFKGSIQ